MKKTICTQFMRIVLCVLCAVTALQSQNLHTECGSECHVPADYTTELTLKLPFAAEETTITADIRDGVAYYQGDIMLGELNSILEKGVGRTNGLWPDATIPYAISSGFSADEISKINTAAAAISNGTNLRIVPRTTEDNYVNFVTATGCSSYVGMIGGAQEIRLASACSYGSTIHEILHAAGIYHEQSRADRDNYVVINLDNIQPDKVNNFNVATIGNPMDFGPYDYNSIMHYYEYAFAITNPNGTPVGRTITTIPAGIPIGQRDGLSAGDVATVNAMYLMEDSDVSLCTYPTTAGVIPVSGITQNLSGVTYNPLTNTLFMVSNGPLNIYETRLDGVVLRTISLNGFDDTEGIVHIGGTEFALTDEETRRITFINIFPTTSSITASNNYIQVPNGLGPWGNNSNKSLEGVSYNPATNTIYTVKEGDEGENVSKGFYAFERPSSLPASLSVADVNQLCNISQDPYGLNDLAGMHHLGLTFSGNTDVLLLSEASNTLLHLDENCNEIDRLSLNFISQPEGITMDRNGNIYIVGEPNHLVVLSPDPSLDIDGDGICNDEDNCDNNLTNTPCNDGDDCTTGETYDENCICTGGTPVPNCGEPTCRQSDSLALVDFFNATNGNTWSSDIRWDLQQPIDTWYGVTLNSNQCVDRLVITAQNLSGTLSPSIGNLSELTYLHLANNNFIGEIPASIGDLSNLQFLYLHVNGFTEVPAEIGELSNLSHLYLNGNQLTELPASIGDLSSLTRLYLYSNQLTELPSSIGNLSSLFYLYAQYNELTSIPSSIGNLSNLNRLYLYNNQLESVPPSIGDLNNLARLYLQDNELTSVPASIGDLTNLLFLYLQANQLTSLPTSIGDLSNLDRLYAHYNQLQTIPSEIGDLSNLTRLYLYQNQLNSLPASLGNLAQLIELRLRQNQITGDMPTWLADLENLEKLTLYTNQFSGCYADELAVICNRLVSPFSSNIYISGGNNFDKPWEDFCSSGSCETSCRQTDSLALIAIYDGLNGDDWYSGRQWDFTQPMDTWYGITLNDSGCVDWMRMDEDGITGTLVSEIGDLSEIRGIELTENAISGTIPTSIGNLSNLEYLSLADNHLTGTIPVSISNLTNLKTLYLGANRLTGTIPGEIGNLTNLEALSLGWNNLMGTIPVEIGNLIQLRYLNLAGSNLSGSIPAQIGNLTQLTSLYLNNNELSSIPPEIGNLTNMQYLYLHYNQLSGIVPAEIGNLSALTSLRLYNNQLTGLPNTISNLDNLGVLWVQSNQLTGLPSTIGNMDKLYSVDLGFNELTTIPSTIGNIANLRYLIVRNNQLTSLPSTIGNLDELQNLIANNNQIAGNLPSWLLSMNKLRFLKLNDNQMSGCYFNSLTLLCSKLSWYGTNANISDGNNFAAEWEDFCDNGAGNCDIPVPPCRQNDSLALVDVFYAANGNTWRSGIRWDLTQPMDTWYGVTLNDNQCVDRLAIFEEDFGGTLSPSIGDLSEITYIDLSENQINGQIPSEIGNLTNLTFLSLGINNLDGEIPSSLGNLSDLTRLYLHNNELTGNIPDSFEDMSSIEAIILRNNQLSGCYSLELIELCTQLGNFSRNSNISNGNNFTIPWEDFCSSGTCSSNICGNDANTLLLLPFDNTLNGVSGETPTTSAHLSYTTGTYNEALNVLAQSDAPLLRYPASGNINSQAGSVEAWVKPTWNGNDGVARTILQYGAGGGILIAKDGANNLRLILNRFSPTGYPEVGVAYNISDWQAHQWKHVAFTWGSGTMKLYINGTLMAEQDYSVNLFPISDAEFSVGVEVSYFHWQGAIDHFRISGVARSQGDIVEFMNNCTGTKVADNQTIDMSNFPNPFTNQTTITYTLPEDSPVTLTIYDGTGRQVALLHDQEFKAAGEHTVHFEGGHYPAGMYYCTIQAGAYSGTQKMILTK